MSEPLSPPAWADDPRDDAVKTVARLSPRDQLALLFAAVSLVGSLDIDVSALDIDVSAKDVARGAWEIGGAMADLVIERAAAAKAEGEDA